ncbi:MAG TPA: dihydrofolate reductase family protein [Dehalococcoidia bacterium]|nr:dihydrofolate reductase family protein [Dehalococcoidia bacterium]
MRKIIVMEHVSLDGYLGGPGGEMDWIHVGPEMWEYVDPLTAQADAAIFGRITYEMMLSYWPTAGDGPGATSHDKNHSRWLNDATKVLVSSTTETASWAGRDNVTLVRNDVTKRIREIKQQPGKDMLLFGSASVARALIGEGLVDEYRLMLNPVILGAGISLFPDAGSKQALSLVESRVLEGGVVALSYQKSNE